MRLFDQLIVKTLPLVPKPIVASLSRPYIAGDNLDAAVNCVKSLNQKGFQVTIDILGEFVTHWDQAEESAKGYMDVLNAIKKHKLQSGISVKPTFFGLLLDQGRCEQLLWPLLEACAGMDKLMRLDMEDTPCTTKTIELYSRFQKKYPDHVGIVLQSYLRRTLADVQAITEMVPKANFRICKGIYVEPLKLAYHGYQEIRDNFIASAKAMWDGGAFVGLATHDDYLVEKSIEIIRERRLGPEDYEFQMLLGVREKLRDQILADGHNVRIYVPFGKDWYGYSVRRLKENPALAGTMFKAIFFGK